MIELPKGMRIFTPKQSRMFRRLARQALRSMRIREAMQPLGELVQSQLDGLPPTTFRCAICGRRAYSYDPDAGLSARNGQLDPGCPEHGPLQHLSVADWRSEWTRRGRPNRLNLKLRKR